MHEYYYGGKENFSSNQHHMVNFNSCPLLNTCWIYFAKRQPPKPLHNTSELTLEFYLSAWKILPSFSDYSKYYYHSLHEDEGWMRWEMTWVNRLQYLSSFSNRRCFICKATAITDFKPVITFTSGCPVVVRKLSVHDFTLHNLGRWEDTIHLMSTTN